MASQPNVILSPHLDDAVFDCWHLLTKADTVVLNVFSGIPPEGTKALWDRICGEADSHKMVQMRLAENQTAMGFSGNPNQQLFLGLLDAQYRHGSGELSVSDLADNIEKDTPKNSLFFAPLAISRIFRHPDHVRIRKVGLELLRRGHKVGFFPDYPYMTTPQKPKSEKLNQIRIRAEKELGISLTFEILELTSEQLETKRNAMKAYKTQYRVINIETLGALTRLGKQKYELVFVAN